MRGSWPKRHNSIGLGIFTEYFFQRTWNWSQNIEVGYGIWLLKLTSSSHWVLLTTSVLCSLPQSYFPTILYVVTIEIIRRVCWTKLCVQPVKSLTQQVWKKQHLQVCQAPEWLPWPQAPETTLRSWCSNKSVAAIVGAFRNTFTLPLTFPNIGTVFMILQLDCASIFITYGESYLHSK